MYADAAPITADESRQRLDEITRVIIGAAHKVSSTLGFGFLEKVYENALAIEVMKRGFRVCLLMNFGRSRLELRRIVSNY